MRKPGDKKPLKFRTTVKENKIRSRKIALIFTAIVLAVALLVAVAFPTRAYAAAPWDLQGAVEEAICKWILGGASWFFNTYDGLIRRIAENAPMSRGFSSLLGGGMYSLMVSIHQTAVVPIGESLLALFMLVQLVKISQRMDATATLPAVKDIVFLAVIFVIMHWLITHSLDIVSSIYGIFNRIMPSIGSAGSVPGFLGGTIDISEAEMTDVTIGGALATFFVSVLTFLAGMVSYVVVFVTTYARAWQIYVLAAFSPIPLALLGFEDTRQMGIGFLKNFSAACLAGLIMMFLLVAFPNILSASFSQMNPDSILEFGLDSLVIVLMWIGSPLLLVFGLVKSGAWAKEVLGG